MHALLSSTPIQSATSKHTPIPVSQPDDMVRKHNTETMLRQISVVEEPPNDQQNDDNTTYDNKEIKKKQNAKSSNYKMFDKETRRRVLCSCYLAICFLAIGLCIASIKVRVFQEASLKGLRMWQWCLLIAALLSGPLLSYAIVKFIMLFIDRDFSIRENVIYYVVGLGESATVVLWFSMILVAWLWVVDEPSYLGLPQQDIGVIKKKYATTFHIITVTLVTLILGSFLWVLKDLVIMKAKSSFHIRRFFDRIKKALFHQYVIERLSQGSQAENSNSQDDTDFVITSSSSYKTNSFRKVGLGRKERRVVDLSSFEDVRQENVSCWGMKILIEEMIENPSLKYYKYSQDEKKIECENIDGENEAILAAKTIFPLMVSDEVESPHLGKRELLRCFSKEKLDEVENCLLEGAHSRHVQIDIFKKWMVKVYKYRKALVRALDANKSLFKMFNRFVDVLLVFLIFALWLIMLRVETRKVIFLIGSALVGSAFIFGETTKKLLENILFVFLVHPFDIGDCCLIDNTPVIIEEINFLTTTVLTFDNEMKHYPNAVLSNQSISNYTRSPHMGDFVTLSLDINTPTHKLDHLRNKIRSYIENNPQYWAGGHHWEIELENMTTIKMTLRLQHTINYHEFTERQVRKSELVLEIKNVLLDVALTVKSTTGDDVAQ
ncbi:mechanosensitive ion channel protein 10-like [Silene latifolia]|uniref:mechanosensitive ion channel protein 10-like n=1 Tax=Silene latifolia TaxID=37657 RepID=UPI003D7863EA